MAENLLSLYHIDKKLKLFLKVAFKYKFFK